MTHKVYYITVGNIEPDLIGFNGGKLETKFIDILAGDSFVMKKHFTSSIFPWDSFFSVATGMANPDDDDQSLVGLLNSEIDGIVLCPRKDVKAFNNKYEDLVDVHSYPNDFAAKALKYIKSEKCGLFHAHYAYEDNVFKMDSAIGKLMAAIEEFGDYDESYIVFTAFTGVAGKPSPTLIKIPYSGSIRFYSSMKKVNFVTRDIDILPTVFDLQEEYYRLPLSIDGTSIVNNMMGKDQKLYAINRPMFMDPSGEAFFK